jgi:hypothetical protein
LLAANGATEHPFDHGVGALLDSRLQWHRQIGVAADALNGFEGAFDGEADTGLVELLDAPVPLANKELPALQGVDSEQVQLILILVFHGESPTCPAPMKPYHGLCIKELMPLLIEVAEIFVNPFFLRGNLLFDNV